MVDLPLVLSGAYAESELKDFSDPIDEDERAKNYDYHSDSDLEDDEDASNAAKTQKGEAPLEIDHSPANAKESTPVRGEWNEPPGKGTIIKIHDIAFITYVSSNPHCHTPDDCPDSKPFQCTSILVISSLVPTDRRKIAGQGVLTSPPVRKIRYLDRRQSRSTDLQTRYPLIHHRDDFGLTSS